MAVVFSLNAEDAKRIEEEIKMFQQGAEKSINNYLDKDGKEIMIEGITDYTPMSDRNKKHAKRSNAYKAQSHNLSVRIGSKKPFGYLYFQNEGVGCKANQRNEEYMAQGLETKKNKIVNEMLEAIERSM